MKQIAFVTFALPGYIFKASFTMFRHVSRTRSFDQLEIGISWTQLEALSVCKKSLWTKVVGRF